MASYELQPLSLRRTASQGEVLGRSLEKTAERLRDCARALDYDGSPFECLQNRMGNEFQRLLRQQKRTKALFSALSSVTDEYLAAEHAVENEQAYLPVHASGSASKAGIELESSVKTRSADSESAAGASGDPGFSGGGTYFGFDVAESSIADAVSASTGNRPRSAAVFSAMNSTDRAGYLASVAAVLYAQFPTLAISCGGKISVPLGKGMWAYTGTSVSGGTGQASSVKVSHAIEANTNTLKEGISISNDGSTVSFTKNGVSCSVKTSTGTWEMDPTTLSRTTTARLDAQTTATFKESVDARGFISMETSVSTKTEGCSVTTSVGLKTSDPGDQSAAASSVTAKSPVPVSVTSAQKAYQSRVQTYLHSLGHILAGGIVPVPGAAGIPVPVPVV